VHRRWAIGRRRVARENNQVRHQIEIERKFPVVRVESQ